MKRTGETYVALLRGINVGGKNMLPMADLVKMFERAGCARVRHYIQSGNVLFDADAKTAANVHEVVRADIEKRFGFRTPIVLRAAGEIAKVAAKHPLLLPDVDPVSLHVMFLADAPGKSAIAVLDSARSPPDSFVVKGREIFLCYPNGAGRSK